MFYTLVKNIKKGENIMKKALKRVLCSVLACVLLAGTGFLAYSIHIDKKMERLETQIFPITQDLSSYELKEIEAVWLFSPADKAKLVYYYDYVFIAKIDELVGTSYSNVRKSEGGKINADPYTNYKITNLYNIKGNLKTNVSFPFSVYGGVDHTQRFVSAFDNSFIEVGGLYLIIARAKENGEINAFGPNTVLPLTRVGEPDISLLSTSSIEEVYGDVIDIYKEAVAKNDDEFAPENRYKSKYEAEVNASAQ